MEVITRTEENNIVNDERIVCEICDHPPTECDAYKCEEKDCEKCGLEFDRFVCPSCVHTKSLKEMEEIYIRKHHLDEKNYDPTSTSISGRDEAETEEETRHTSAVIEDMTEELSDFEDSEVEEIKKDLASSTIANMGEDDEALYSVLPADDDVEYEKTSQAIEEILRARDEDLCKAPSIHKENFNKVLTDMVALKEKGREVEEEVVTKTELPPRSVNKPEEEEKEKETSTIHEAGGKAEYERVLKAIDDLNEVEYSRISRQNEKEVDRVEGETVVPTHLERQHGVIEDEVIDYRGPIPLRMRRTDKPLSYCEVSDTDSIEELEEEEKKILNEGEQQQTDIRYYEDYQEEDDSGTEADLADDLSDEERLMRAHQEEILERIPETDEASLATNLMAENLVKETIVDSLNATNALDRQDSALTYTSVDKFYEERDFTNVSNDYIRGTSLEEHTTSATPEISDEVIRPRSPIDYDTSEIDTDSDSEYENEYYPLYNHIKMQKCVNRDIRLLRGMLEDKFKIRIYSNELDEVVRAKDEILDKFGLDLGYHEVFNYMERNRLNKRINMDVEKAMSCLEKVGIKMTKITEASKEQGLSEDAIQERIMKICDYVDSGKTIDEMPNSKTDEAVKMACRFFEERLNLKMLENRKTWREKQDEVIDLMDRYRKHTTITDTAYEMDSATDTEEEEVYSEMTEEITRTKSVTPISFKTSPNSDKLEAIGEGFERVRKSFGADHEIRLNALVQITDDLKENIEKLSKLFPGKIKFEIETIPKNLREDITEFKAELKEDIEKASRVIEKTVTPANEKFDIGAFFRNLFTGKKLQTETA